MQSSNSCGFLASEVLKFIGKNENKIAEEEADEQKEHESHSTIDKHRKQKQGIVLIKKQRNIINRAYTLSPLVKQNKLYKLFGYLGVNEEALENPYDCGENVIQDFFGNRIVEKIQIYQHAVMVNLTEPYFPDQPSPQYLIEKYLSKGDKKFQELAMDLKQVMDIYKRLNQAHLPPKKAVPIKKWLDHMGQGMYTMFFGPRKYAISKGLLTFLGYDVQELGIQIVKYRTVLFQLFSIKSYIHCMKHFMKMTKYPALLSLGQISMTEFREQTYFKTTDFIESRNHVKSYCDQIFYFLGTECCVHQIGFIYYQTDEMGGKMIMNQGVKESIQQQKEQINHKQVQTLKKMQYFGPRSMKFAEYIQKPTNQDQL